MHYPVIKPVADMHCDLLDYLSTVGRADPNNTADIGCAAPFLRDGGVKLQVLAISSVDELDSKRGTERQCEWFRRLTVTEGGTFHRVTKGMTTESVLECPRICVIAAIENASALASDSDPLEVALRTLDRVDAMVGPLFYMSFTHHLENRFGGGNSTDVGLKDDGAILLEYVAGRNIAVDLSHASDALASDIISYIDRKRLDVPLIASHSNFREILSHQRNLPKDIAEAIIDRQGLIGITFLRALLHPDDPGALVRHIEYGLTANAHHAMCFGSDYFYTDGHPDRSRIPFFFDEHENAGRYQDILNSVQHLLTPAALYNLAFGNVMAFLQRLWQPQD